MVEGRFHIEVQQSPSGWVAFVVKRGPRGSERTSVLHGKTSAEVVRLARAALDRLGVGNVPINGLPV